MPIREVSWQRRGGRPTEPPAVAPPPLVASDPRGVRRLLHARPAGRPLVLLGTLALLIVAVHASAFALELHPAWIWAAVASIAGASLAADWRDALREPLDAPATRRAALAARITLLALLAALLSLLTL